MGAFWKIVFLASILCLASAQFGGRYNRYRPTQRTRLSDGRYQPSNDGRYRPLNDGRYRPDDAGKYAYKGGGAEGKYVHKDVGGGQYSGDGGKYAGGGGNYKDDTRKYSGGSGNYKDRQYSGETGKSSTGALQPSLISPSRASAIDFSQLKPLHQGKGSSAGGGGWRILRDVKQSDQEGYHYLFETENGILAEEQGNIENRGSDQEGLKSTGFFEYTGDDGLLYRVDYVADNNGFVPRGDHIPKTPRIIEKLVAYLATKPPSTEKYK